MSTNIKKLGYVVLGVLIPAGIIGCIGWMRSMDANTYRTAEILERIQSDNVRLQIDVKANTGIVIKNSERLNEHDRRLDDHQRQLESINRKGG